MSSSSDEDSDITYNSEESVSEDLREAYQKVRREVYAIRKREKNPTFDLEEEEPRLIDLLNSAQKKGKVPEYNSDTWDDTKFVLLTILVSGALGFGLYYTLHAFGMYELEDAIKSKKTQMEVQTENYRQILYPIDFVPGLYFCQQK